MQFSLIMWFSGLCQHHPDLSMKMVQRDSADFRVSFAVVVTRSIMAQRTKKSFDIKIGPRGLLLLLLPAACTPAQKAIEANLSNFFFLSRRCHSLIKRSFHSSHVENGCMQQWWLGNMATGNSATDDDDMGLETWAWDCHQQEMHFSEHMGSSRSETRLRS